MVIDCVIGSAPLRATEVIVPHGTEIRREADVSKVGDSLKDGLTEGLARDDRPGILQGAVVEGTTTEIETLKNFAGLNGRASIFTVSIGFARWLVNSHSSHLLFQFMVLSHTSQGRKRDGAESP